MSWCQWTCFFKKYNLLCSIKWTIILMTALSLITLLFLCRWLWITWSIRSTWRNPRKLSGSSPKRSDTAHLLIHSFICSFSLIIKKFYSFIHWVSHLFIHFICMFVLFSTVLFHIHMYVYNNNFENSLLNRSYLLNKLIHFSIVT